MRSSPFSLLTLALAFATGISIPLRADDDIASLMPRPEDRVSHWWRDGFPGIVEGAGWRQVVKTGHYWFLLDTDTLAIPRLGPVGLPIGELPGADLDLAIEVDGRRYTCRGSEPWSRFTGPRLIESGRFLQRSDITPLRFVADDGSKLNADTRFETVTWPDRLGLILAARPGYAPLEAGEASFGKIQGGFGLDGGNQWVVGPEQASVPATFTLSFWVYSPSNFKAGEHSPWLVCQNAHEQADGNFGVMANGDGDLQVRMNVGGGRENSFEARSRSRLRLDQWNHLAIRYDGSRLSLYANGQVIAGVDVGRERVPVPGPLTLGNRGDGLGEGAFRFRGVIDEIRLYGQALELGQLRHLEAHPDTGLPHLAPLQHWGFRQDVAASPTLPRETWNTAALSLRYAEDRGETASTWTLPEGETWTTGNWQETALVIDPVHFPKAPPTPDVSVTAVALPGETPCPVVAEPHRGWIRINLDTLEPQAPPGGTLPSNDALGRARLSLSNSTDREQVVRLVFEKTRFRHGIGTPITGISAILRDAQGHPTGLPIQLSKNWHSHPQDGGVYNGQWFHGISLLRLPPRTDSSLELTLAHGHWGGVAAASHAQLSLIGWGSNQRWDQAAIGAWGENICFAPEQIQTACSITDVRPLMVTSTREGHPRWGWTTNVGGGDFFRFFDPSGERQPHTRMRSDYLRHGPCLTEVTYEGRIGASGLFHRETVSLARTDDFTRATYRIHLRADEAIDFTRLVFFQIGADTYLNGSEKKMAFGNETGLLEEWETQKGGNVYRGGSRQAVGRLPWVSLHDAERAAGQPSGAWANRGIVIREWDARLGGKAARPWIAERGVEDRGKTTSTLDIVPPPGLARLEAGDYVTATVEHLILPQQASDYYGPSEDFRDALAKMANTWKLVHWHALGDDRRIEVGTGILERRHPDLRIATADGVAELTLDGGTSFTPLTFSGLASHRGHRLVVDGKPLDQGIHGNDFWQADFDPVSGTWSHTYNLPPAPMSRRHLRFEPVTTID